MRFTVIAGMFIFSMFVADAEASDARPRANSEQLRRALDSIRVEYEVPGMAAAIFDREEIQVYVTGERSDGLPVNENTRFNIGQTGGLLTALTVLQLDADGALPLDKPVRDIAPELDIRNAWIDSPITLCHLLTHSAGVTPPHFRDVFVKSPAPLLGAINRAFRALDLASRPGAETRYSLAGYGVAAYAAERAVGMPYENLIETLLISPLALSAGYQESENDAVGLNSRQQQAVLLTPNFSVITNVRASANDLALIGSLLLNDGLLGEHHVLARDAVAALLMDAKNPRTPEWRPGLKTVEHEGFLFYEQSGALPGFLSVFAISPSLEHGYVVLMNRGDAAAALHEAASLLRGQILAGRQPPPRPKAVMMKVPEGFAGFWKRGGWATPQERYWSEWLDIAYAAECAPGLICWQALLMPSRQLEMFEHAWLRETNAWYPGWRVGTVENNMLELHHLEQQWRKASVGGVISAWLLAGFALAGIITGLVYLPFWLGEIWRGEIRDYHEWLPRMLPAAAAVLFVIWQWRLFALEYPALGEVSAASVTVLILSVLFPLSAVAALLVALAGARWGISKTAVALNIFISLGALAAAAWMIPTGLIAFQSWNF